MMDRVERARAAWEDDVYKYGQDSRQAKLSERTLMRLLGEEGVNVDSSQYSSFFDRIWPDNAWHLLGISGPGGKGDEYRSDVTQADSLGRGTPMRPVPARGTPMRPVPARGTPMRPVGTVGAETAAQSVSPTVDPATVRDGWSRNAMERNERRNAPRQSGVADAQAAADRARAKEIERQEAAARERAAIARWEALGITGVRDVFRQARREGLDVGGAVVAERIRKSQQFRNLYGDVMDARVKAGLSSMTPLQIQAQRAQYRTLMRNAGLPTGFYDDITDFDAFISQDVSVDEVASRISLAQQVVGESVSADTTEAFRRYYGIKKGDLVAYYLDPDRAEPLLQKRAQAAILGGEATTADIGIGRKYAENLVEKGISPGQARQAFQDTAADMPQLDTLAGLDGVDLSQKDVINANLDLSPNAAKKVKGLASRERARFGGSSDASRAFGGNTGGF